MKYYNIHTVSTVGSSGQFPVPEWKCVVFLFVFFLLALLVSVGKCESKAVVLVLLFSLFTRLCEFYSSMDPKVNVILLSPKWNQTLSKHYNGFIYLFLIYFF